MKKLRYEKLQEKKKKLENKLIPIFERFTQVTGLVINGIEIVPDVDVMIDERFNDPKAKEVKITYSLKINAGV